MTDSKTFLEAFEASVEEASPKNEALRDYITTVDGALIERGWDHQGAKTVAFGYHDQSLLNHVRNGVFFLHQLNAVAGEHGRYRLNPSEFRHVLGMYVSHDLHKEIQSHPDEGFDIERETVEEFINEVGLLDFAPESITSDDFINDCWACICAHHKSNRAKTEHVTLQYDELEGYVRLADAFASNPTPADAADDRSRRNFDDVFFGELDLRFHQLDEVTGILTNLLNQAVADVLENRGYHLLTIYQDGCVYAAPSTTDNTTVDGDFVEKVYEKFTERVRNSHPSYKDPEALMDSIDTGRLGYYDPTDEDFFFAGPESVLRAMVWKAATDGDTDDDTTDSMSEGIAKTAAEVPIELDDTRQLVAAARLVYGLHRTIVPELDAESEDIEVTCDIFGVSDEVREALLETREREPKLLKSGGKWEYSYAIGQELLERHFTDPDGSTIPAKRLSPSDFADAVSQFLLSNLSKYGDWQEIVAESFTEDIRAELIAFIADVLTVDGSRPTFDTELADTFDEYTKSRGGKICTLSNRGTTGTKGEMEAKKSLTTLQAGFSNRVRIGAGKPEKLLVAAPHRIEFTLRETGSSRRDAGRLFIHLAPDYFFTPLSWALTRQIVTRYGDDARTQVGRLADVLFEGGGDEEAYVELREYLTTDEGRLSMLECLSQGFDHGFGAEQLAFDKPHENETEFQFFGVYVALAVASYSGLRVLVSDHPMPDVLARDFKEMVRLGGGLSPVARFYGEGIELDRFEETVKAASALIALGYANDRTDSLFPKYLRATRNKPLPGSYLLKRIVRDSDEGSRIAWNLMDQAKYLDTHRGYKTSDTMNETSDIMDELARRAFDVMRPTSFKAYAVERPFRESVKAITDLGTTRPSKQDCKHYVAGRIQKTIDRSEQVYPVSAEKSEYDGDMGERIESYADFFVEKVYGEICEENPSRLKRLSNNLADGFYAATLRLIREQSNDEQPDN